MKKKVAKPTMTNAILHFGHRRPFIGTSPEQIGTSVQLPSCCKPHGCIVIPVVVADARLYKAIAKRAVRKYKCTLTPKRPRRRNK